MDKPTPEPDDLTVVWLAAKAEDADTIAALRAEVKRLRTALYAATDWCGRQASALHRLGTEPEKRAAFAEAHNAVQEIARAPAIVTVTREEVGDAIWPHLACHEPCSSRDLEECACVRDKYRAADAILALLNRGIAS